MLSLSNEVFNALSKYIIGDWSIDQFRDFMVELRVDKYKLLADADRLFLNEFEGRYAEYCDFHGCEEPQLKAALVQYVQSDEAATAPATASFWSFRAERSTGSFSINVGSPSPTGTFIGAAVGAGR